MAYRKNIKSQTKRKFSIRYALGGGFGGCGNKEWEKVEADNAPEALRMAHDNAIAEYISHENAGDSLPTEDSVREDNPGMTNQEVVARYCEERELWLEYEVRGNSSKNPPKPKTRDGEFSRSSTMFIGCPLCDGATMDEILDHDGKRVAYVCRECPCVVFEFSVDEDVERVRQYLLRDKEGGHG